MREARGRIMMAQREIKLGTLSITGTFPRIIVYVKVGSRRMRDEFTKACKRLGIDINPNEDGTSKVVQVLDGETRDYAPDKLTYEERRIPDGLAAYDVAGSPESLEALSKLPCIAEAHFVLDCGVPRSCGHLSAIYPGPRPPREATIKMTVEKRKMADANVKHWENEHKRQQVEEYGVSF